jgi:FkbM family methyltransferase
MTDWKVVPSVGGASLVTIKDFTIGDFAVRGAELVVAGKTLRYGIENTAAKWRVETLFQKEPMTIEWLHSFRPGEVLVDVGANIGMYSCYAAKVMGTRVYSFEPESQNYAELNRNIMLNDAFKEITAWCAALADRQALSHLLLNRFGTGFSHHDFATASRATTIEPRRQGAIGFSLDQLLGDGSVPPPDHIKIDVDGHENLVVKGMQRFLEGNHLKTILVECDPRWPHVLEMVDNMLDMGYVYNVDEFRLTRDGILEADFVEEAFRRGEFGNNIVFSRDPGRIDYASRWLDALDAEAREALNVTPEVWYRSNPGLLK